MHILHLLLITLFALNPLFTLGQEKQIDPPQARLEGLTAFVLYETKAYISGHKKGQPIPSHLLTQYNIQQKAGGYYIGAIVQLDSKVDWQTIESLNVRTTQITETIYTAQIPLPSLEAFAKVAGVLSIDAGMKAQPALDTARVEIKADMVFNGTGLPQPFRGKGVIVGIVDKGYDYHHPVFRTLDTTALRISRVWDQNDTSKSAPVPSPFTYGTEIIGDTAIMAQMRDSTNGTHGIHVTGIAAGSGAGSSGSMIGIAPESEIVLVSSNFSPNGILDGIKYIFNYADAVNKPCVVNLSIAGFLGRRDGTSVFDRTTDNLVKNGRLIVGAVGNYAASKMHFGHTFTTPDSVRTIIPVKRSDSEAGHYNYLEIYSAERFKFLEANVLLLDSLGNEVDRLSKNINTVLSAFVTDTLTYQGDTAIVLYESSNPNFILNGRSKVQIKVSTPDTLRLHFALEIKGSNVSIHCWNSGLLAFTDSINGQGIAGMLPGDTSYTLTEIGGTGKSIISVGGYTTKNHYQNVYGHDSTIVSYSVIGAKAPFSSLGPTLDGRVKPQITAPANVVASATSRFTSEIDSGWTVLRTPYMNDTFTYSIWWGTSFAAPIVTGTVALMLSIAPTLSYDDALKILTTTARTDAFTGAIDPLTAEPTYRWGWGKLDVFAAVSEAMNYNARAKGEEIQKQMWIYPNPANEQATLLLSNMAHTDATISIYDLAGKRIKRQSISIKTNAEKVAIETNDLPTGYYSLQLSHPQGAISKKLIVTH